MNEALTPYHASPVQKGGAETKKKRESNSSGDQVSRRLGIRTLAAKLQLPGQGFEKTGMNRSLLFKPLG